MALFKPKTGTVYSEITGMVTPKLLALIETEYPTHAKRFNLMIQFGLTFFLTVLLLNFLIFSHFHDKNVAIETSLQSSAYQLATLEKIKERVLQKETRLQKIISSKSSKVAFYLDEIGKSIPATVLLDELAFQPLLKPLRTQEAITYNPHILMLKGSVKDKFEFLAWTARLRTCSWIKEVAIVSYDYREKNTFDFEIILTIHDMEY